GWSSTDVEKKWASQVPRATPVAMPATLGQQRGSIFSDPPAGAPAEGASPQQQAAQWKTHSWDDIGNAERLMVYSGGLLRWIADLKKWARYERGSWHVESEAGERMAVEMLARFDQWEAPLYSADKGGQDKSPRQKFVSWAKDQRSAVRVA